MKTLFRGRQEYVPLWREMQDFTDTRDANTADEIWFVEHPPVFTMGLNASEEHLLAPGDIPVVQAAVVVLSVIFISLNLIVDLVYARIDPRVKL